MSGVQGILQTDGLALYQIRPDCETGEDKSETIGRVQKIKITLRNSEKSMGEVANLLKFP